MFGAIAAFAAIALEGAPFRRSNILGLRYRGHERTFFSHLSEPDPFCVIEIPNHEVKNGPSLDLRGKTLPRIELRKWEDGPQDYAPEILAWYLETVRPLFGGAAETETLFPPVMNAHPQPRDHIAKGTFDLWLAHCSAEIDLPLTSHRFRHARCSIALEFAECSLPELADYLGDAHDTIGNYYAFIDRDRAAKRHQQNISNRRRRYLDEAQT